MTKTRDLSDFLIEGGADLPLGKPHIVPGVLYPGYNDKQIDGTTALAASTTGPAGSTVTSSKYGTVQSDGRMYYYTDIIGSKPIKDPRIGAHFGSQRHQFRSIQLLEQETATQGANTYSVDGREWVRISGTATTDIEIKYHGSGNMIKLGNATDFIEITGYFNDINIRLETHPNYDGWTKQLNGGSASAGQSAVSQDSPLTNRYVDSGSVLNVGVGATLGINTVRINSHNLNIYVFGIELIAQDTTSTANRSKIQIPAQNVVSFGKKFNVSGTPHYDPFNGFTSGNLATVQALGIDTDSSLGLNKWLLSGTYYRPFNGARVVKYVDSTGTIKTAVTVMPPNAKSIANSASPTNAFATRTTASHYATNNAMNSFEVNGDGIDSDNLSEVAKTFRWREFGNGSANAGTNAGSYKDFSMLSGTAGQDNAYVMDDGLTSLSGKTVEVNSNGLGDNLGLKTTDSAIYYTFIGTGITISDHTGSPRTFGQNLPYGTHVVRQHNDGSNVDWYIDGVQLLEGDSGDTGITAREITFHQPKRPPIPEDACVLADYMLMADFVAQTDAEPGQISKGTRLIGASRDIFYDSSGSLGGLAFDIGNYAATTQIKVSAGSSATMTAKLPFFGTTGMYHGYQGSATITLGGTSTTKTVLDNSVGADGDIATIAESVNLGMTDITATIAVDYNIYAFQVATPIHTSHHYQTFETPFLHELVGGDRNMEQTNLVCSPDGKTWDEITRDTSYIGNGVLFTRDNDTTYTTDTSTIINDDWRGVEHSKHFYNKDFAIAYDRVICLKDGQYVLHFQTYRGEAGDRDIHLNSAVLARGYQNSAGTATMQITTTLKRGDYLQTVGRQSTNSYVNFFWIKKA